MYAAMAELVLVNFGSGNDILFQCRTTIKFVGSSPGKGWNGYLIILYS